jgi:hypothetical protein
VVTFGYLPVTHITEGIYHFLELIFDFLGLLGLVESLSKYFLELNFVVLVVLKSNP